MLEIDYSLVEMSAADQQAVRNEVLRRVEAGQIPPPDRSVNGRMALVNPDLVQTTHQIPDELRPRLRRITVPAQEGSTHLTAQRLYDHIVESDERLYLIVIELQSEFRSLSSFLDCLPLLRAQYPELAILLSGTLHHLRAKLRQVLAEGGATLVLEFEGGKRVTEIADAETFDRIVSTQEQVVRYATPFFTDVRLLLEKGGKPIPFNLLTLRKLHSVFGHGVAEEVEVGKGRKERMIVVDLPVPLIHDFRFRQDRGLDFLGVVIDGVTVQSRHFGDEKLEFRWVPMRAVERFLRRNPSGVQEEIDMKGVGALRVNTLTGEVSFLMKQAGEKVAVEQATALHFRKPPLPATTKWLGGRLPPDVEQIIAFDRYLPPGTNGTHGDGMQEAVRGHFYHKLIGEEVEHARKQELYAQRLRVGAVGPLAGQTLKLLRRHGLEQLIDPESFFYVCDTPEELPFHPGTGKRYEAHFANLVEVIREVAVGKPADRVRIADVAYNMPISTEWVDAGLATLDKVSNQELEAVYQEMRLLSDFIAHEFRRNFDIQQEDLSFFSKMQTCRDASLIAKWLAEFKRGAYGAPLPEDAHPDVVFFANDEDKKENDTRYYFPGLSCAELLTKPENKGLFDEFDYAFSVFLEDQMALAVHAAREQGVLKPALPQFTSYFAAKIEEMRAQEQELRTMLKHIDDENSPIYKQLLEQEERAYHERYAQFLQDRARVESELAETTGRAEEIVQELRGQLDMGEATEEEFFRDTPGHPELLEQRMLGAAARTRTRIQETLQQAFGLLTDTIDAWRGQLDRLMLALRRTLHYRQGWQSAQEAVQTAALRDQMQAQLGGRMEQLRRMKALERDQHARRLQTQLRNYQGELGQMNARLGEHAQKNQRAATTLQAYVQSAAGRLEDLKAAEPGVAPEKVVQQALALRKLLVNVSSNAGALAGRVQEMHEGLEKMRVRKQRHMQQLYQFRAELVLVRAVEEHSEPLLPKVQVPGGKMPVAADVERLQQTWQSQQAAMVRLQGELGGAGQGVDERLQAVRAQAVQFQRFVSKQEELIKAMARKARLRDSAKSLAERQTLMDEELTDLPQRVREQFMPARKQLLVEVFLPETEQRIGHFSKAETFVTELLSLKQKSLKEKYLDRGIYRRFYGRQFMRGGAYAADPNSRLHFPTRNVAPALRLLHRAIVYNFKRLGLPGQERIELPMLSLQEPKQILGTIANMAAVQGRGQFDFLVLPPTLELKEGLELLHRKDELYEGVPRLVLIYVTKFDPQLLRRDPELRDSYFRALKHNVVLNIDGRAVVDNPRSIGMRLLHETLGCAIDLPHAEEPPEVASAAG